MNVLQSTSDPDIPYNLDIILPLVYLFLYGMNRYICFTGSRLNF